MLEPNMKALDIIEAFVKALNITEEWPDVEVFFNHDQGYIEVEVETIIYRSPIDDGHVFTRVPSNYPDTLTI